MAIVTTDNKYYSAIASAIREKNGSSASYTPAQMATAIQNIQALGEAMSIETVREICGYGDVPSGYTRLNYIQSSGTQYIDTQYFANQNTKVVADVEYLDSTNYPMICGSYVSGSNQFAIFYNSGWRGWFGSASVTISGGYTGRNTFALDKSALVVGSQSVGVSSSAFTSTLQLYLFAMLQSGGNVYYHSSIRMYSLQIYDNGILVRDFMPCLNPDGVAGLYDKVNGKFYGNAGSGTFTGA